jgi:hypothetical protein
MPMTIECTSEARRIMIGASVTLAIWFGGMSMLALAVEPDAVIAFGPSSAVFRVVESADASILSIGRGFVIARADAPGLSRKFYAGGAWFVWPAIAGSCGSARRS